MLNKGFNLLFSVGLVSELFVMEQLENREANLLVVRVGDKEGLVVIL